MKETDTIDRELFSPYERGLIRCLRRAKGRAGYSAACAIQHLRKAWKIRLIDEEMAAFRAITGEEEAATALFVHLKERRYTGAKKLNHRSHMLKLSVHPFLREFDAAVRPPLGDVDIRVRNLDGFSILELVLRPVEGVELRNEVHPLDIAVFLDSISGLDSKTVVSLPARLKSVTWRVGEPEEVAEAIAPGPLLEASKILGETVSVRLREVSKSAGTGTLLDYLQNEANTRNRLLYAGSSGWPGGVSDCEEMILGRKKRVTILLSLFALLFPHQRKALLVQQGLLAFLAALKPIDFAKVSEFW